MKVKCTIRKKSVIHLPVPIKKTKKAAMSQNFHSVSVRISPIGPVYLGAVLCARPRCLSIWGILNVGALLALVEHLSVKW